MTLPFPPPTNGLYRNTKDRGGRAKTTRYKAWQNNAILDLVEQGITRQPIVTGPIHLVMVFGRPDRRKRDLDNLLKAPIDLLVSQGVIEDDRNVQSIVANWGVGKGVEVVVDRAG